MEEEHMNQTMDMQPSIEQLLNRIPTSRRDEAKRASAKARLEYRTGGETLRGIVSEDEFVASRLVDEGLATLAAPEPPQIDQRPLHEIAPGLCVKNPTGNQVGSTE